jgi:hypothetical protein
MPTLAGSVAARVDRVRRVWYRHRVIRVRAARQARAPGKAVRIRRDPVTVTGDETRVKPLAQQAAGREGAGSRTIRKPGDLPGRATIDRSSREEPGELVSFLATSRIANLPARVRPAATFRTRMRR